MIDIYKGDNLKVLADLPSESFDLIYIDPPFNTKKTQTGSRRNRTIQIGSMSFEDTFTDFLAFLAPRIRQAHRLLKPTGAFFFHIDYREVHYCKILIDSVFSREAFQNEIIWAYDYGGRATRRWSPKHDNILWYTKDPANYTYRFEDIDRIPYMAPGLVGPDKAERGKTPTDTWWHTIVPTNGKERTGYPTQKPLGILNRIIAVHSRPGDLILDFFAGSGTTGAAAVGQGRDAVLVDSNPEAIEIMRKRFEAVPKVTFYE
jgi:site-specific DNA-methyltransferase (adenine-specific)